MIEQRLLRYGFVGSLILTMLLTGTTVFAHEMRPALLQIRQVTSTGYDITWKIPGGTT